MKKSSLYLIFYLSIINYANSTKIEEDYIKSSQLEHDSLLHIVPKTYDVKDKNKFSPDTKKILDEIYFRKKIKRNLNSNKNISLDKMNITDELEYYETVKGNPNIDIEIKQPNNTLRLKQKHLSEAAAAMKQGSFETAIILFERLLNQYPNDKFILSSIAASYQKLGEYKIAYKYYEKALILYPDDRLILNNFLLLVTRESPAAALNEFLKLDKIYDNSDFLKAQIAYLYFNAKEYELALNYIQAAISLNTKKPTYYFYKAVILDKLNLTKQAISLYNVIITSGSYKEIGISKILIKERLMELGS